MTLKNKLFIFRGGGRGTKQLNQINLLGEKIICLPNLSSLAFVTAVICVLTQTVRDGSFDLAIDPEKEYIDFTRVSLFYLLHTYMHSALSKLSPTKERVQSGFDLAGGPDLKHTYIHICYVSPTPPSNLNNTIVARCLLLL